MSENIENIFREEIREKKSAATGVKGKAGKTGRVGAMITPADLSPPSYRSARDLGSYNLADLICMLNESPALKSVLLSKMDEEYKSYRQAIEKTFDGIAEILHNSTQGIVEVLKSLEMRIEALEQGLVAAVPHAETDALPAKPKVRTRTHRKWGTTPEEIRQNILEQIHQLQLAGYPINSETIKTQLSGILRFLYGKNAVFKGISEMVSLYESIYATAASAPHSEQT